jgi:hypothetical protein
MATTNYTALLKIPYRINDIIKGTRYDQVKFNIQNLSSQVGGNINVTDTTTTANLIVTESLGGTAVIRFRQKILDEAMAMSIALS